MTDMFLPDVQTHPPQSSWGEAVEGMHRAGIAVPQILHLFNFKPQWTRHLAEFTEMVMRAPSPLAAGERELIAALTSRYADCHF